MRKIILIIFIYNIFEGEKGKDEKEKVRERKREGGGERNKDNVIIISD